MKVLSFTAALALFAGATFVLGDDQVQDPAAAAPISATTTTTTAPPPTTTSSTPTDIFGADPGEAAFAILDERSQLSVVVAAEAMGNSGDPRWIPWLVDLLPFVGPGDALGQVVGALAALTGEDPPDDIDALFLHYGSWVYRNDSEPGVDYLEWKPRLYGLIDTEFERLLAQVDDGVTASRLQWGGVVRGGIPELNSPATIDIAAATHMTGDELTFGAVINGSARAYPHRILDHHELANDTLGGEPVALANCTLCRTGILYSRRVGDRILDFESSGLLTNSNKVMVDRQTNSLWEQLTGIAIAGPLAGTELDRFFMTVTTYGDWIATHPGTDVVAIPEGNQYSYIPGDAYAEYYAGPELWFPTFAAPGPFPPKEEVITLDYDGVQFAFAVTRLGERGPQEFRISGTTGGHTIVVVPTSGGGQIFATDDGAFLDDLEFFEIAAALGHEDAGEGPVAVVGDTGITLSNGRSLSRIQSGQSFWFAWYGNHPETGWWPEAG